MKLQKLRELKHNTLCDSFDSVGTEIGIFPTVLISIILNYSESLMQTWQELLSTIENKPDLESKNADFSLAALERFKASFLMTLANIDNAPNRPVISFNDPVILVTHLFRPLLEFNDPFWALYHLLFCDLAYDLNLNNYLTYIIDPTLSPELSTLLKSSKKELLLLIPGFREYTFTLSDMVILLEPVQSLLNRWYYSHLSPCGRGRRA